MARMKGLEEGWGLERKGFRRTEQRWGASGLKWGIIQGMESGALGAQGDKLVEGVQNVRLEVLSEEQSAECLAVPFHLCVVLWWTRKTNIHGVTQSTSACQCNMTSQHHTTSHYKACWIVMLLNTLKYHHTGSWHAAWWEILLASNSLKWCWVLFIIILKDRFHVYKGQALSPGYSSPRWMVMCDLFVKFVAFEVLPYGFIPCLLWSVYLHTISHFKMFKCASPGHSHFSLQCNFLPSTLHWCSQYLACISTPHLLDHLSQYSCTSTSISQYTKLWCHCRDINSSLSTCRTMMWCQVVSTLKYHDVRGCVVMTWTLCSWKITT